MHFSHPYLVHPYTSDASMRLKFKRIIPPTTTITIYESRCSLLYIVTRFLPFLFIHPAVTHNKSTHQSWEQNQQEPTHVNCYLYFFSASETRVFSERNRKKQHTYIGKFQETCNTHQMLRSIRRRNRLDLEEKIQKKKNDSN